MPKPTVRIRIIRLLKESPLPVKTADIVAIVGIGMRYPRRQVWDALCKMRKRGEVVSEVGANPRGGEKNHQYTCLWWTLTL